MNAAMRSSSWTIADAQCADPEVIRAAFTCAIAIHCDDEAFELANTLCD